MIYKKIKIGTKIHIGEIIYYGKIGGLTPYKIILIHKNGSIDVCRLSKDCIPVTDITPTIFLKRIYAKFL